MRRRWEEAGRDERALRSLALGLLFLCGATLALITIPLPDARVVNRAEVAVVATLGYPAGLVVLGWGRRLPTWAVHGFLAAGSLLAAAGIYAAHGAGAGASAALFYVWVAMFAFHFFSLAPAFGQLALAGASYGVVQGLDGGPGAAVQWVLTMGTAVVAGVVMWLVSRRLRRVAATDYLTGLPNRQALDKVLTVEVARAVRDGSPLCVAVLDIDGFKEVNDRFGHARGDSLLVEETRAWSRHLRATDTLVRYGGDEFVVVLPGASLDEAAEVMGRLTAAGPVPVSAGTAEFNPGDEPAGLLNRADRTLYELKRQPPRAPEPSGER